MSLNNVISLAGRKDKEQRICEEAATWLARLDAGVNDADMQRLDAWLDEDSRHLHALLDMAVLWDQASLLSTLSDVFPLAEYRQGRVRRQRRQLILGGGAALAASLAGAFWLLPDRGNVAPRLSAPSVSDYEARLVTSVGEQRTVALPDGSMITLNTGTHLEIQFDETRRDIHLNEGEALFTVARDVARPFRVYAGEQVVEAVGTAFTVQRAGQQGLEVMVTEGVVRLHPGSEQQALSLQAGQFVVMDAQRSLVQRELPLDEMESRLAWQHGMLLFKNEPLSSVLAQAGRYTTLTIDADPAVAALEVEGYFRVGDIESLLTVMESNFPIRIEQIHDRHVILRPR